MMFASKVVLVTGGGSGIGRATARAFAREGGTVVVAGRNDEGLAQTVKLIGSDGGNASAVTADVRRSDDVARLLTTAVAQYDRLDVAVNNAGVIGTPGPVAGIDDDAWSAVLSVNLTGVWLCMKHEINHMRGNGGGAIVNIASSIGAHMRLPGLGAYAATKAAVSALTRTAAREYISDTIRINAVSPGPADTPMSLLPDETEVGRAERMRGTRSSTRAWGRTSRHAGASSRSRSSCCAGYGRSRRRRSRPGDYDRITGAGLAPLPVQRPIPIWIGGQSPRAYRRMGRAADGWFPQMSPGPELDRAITMVAEGAIEPGRFPADLGMEGRLRWTGDTEELIKRAQLWRDAGATHLAVNTMNAGLATVDDHLAALSSASEALDLR